MVFVQLGVFLVCVVLSFALTWVVRNTAVELGWASGPHSGRHIHSKPIPRLGGVAVFGACTISFLVVFAACKLFGWQLGFDWMALLKVLGPATFIFLLGLYDDMRGLGAYQKFAGQAIAASLLYMAGMRVVQVSLLPSSANLGTLVSLGATILWVLWITNAFNLIDGVDGLAAGSALVSTVVIFLIAMLSGNAVLGFTTAAIAGAILGFLRFNFNPATIFLGDCGSLFIGFLLSAVAMQAAQKSSTMVAVAIPIVSFGLPILETIISVARRFISGKPLFAPDREHIHHKLLDLGLSQRQVVMVLYGVTALCGLLSLLLLNPGARSFAVVLTVLGVGLWIGFQHLGYREFDELRRVAQRTLEQKQVIANNIAIRKACQQLASAEEFTQIAKAVEFAFVENDFDGIELLILGSASKALAHQFAAAEQQAGFRWTWQKKGPGQASLAPDWKLSLKLIGANGTSRGTCSFWRTAVSTDTPLLVDINVLTGLQQALADALERYSQSFASYEASSQQAPLRAAATAVGSPMC